MNKAHILLIGNFDKKLIKDLGHDSWRFTHSPDSRQAISILEQQPVDMIIARETIDQLSGYDICLLIKSHPYTVNLPFILLAEKKGHDHGLNGQLFAFPNKIAEFAEIAKKPTSLCKLIKEELGCLQKKEYKKKLPVRPLQLLPVSLPESKNDVVKKLNTALLVERWVSNRVLGLLSASKTKKQVLKELAQAIQSSIKVDFCGLALSGILNPWLYLWSEKSINQQAFDDLVNKVKNNLVLSQNLLLDYACRVEGNGGAKISDLILTPIFGDGTTSGMLIFGKLNGQKFSPWERTITGYWGMYCQSLIEILTVQQEVDKLKSQQSVRLAIDPLTGLYNLEFLIGFLQQQLLFSFRNKLPVCLLMVDVDRFSQINEAIGQNAGDAVLVKLAEKFLGVIRSSDLLARYSSDKFVIVLPNTELKGAKVLAEKLRLEIEQMSFFHGKQPGPGITISIGCAQFDPADLNPETILKDAKLAMQRAKEAGRNKVAV